MKPLTLDLFQQATGAPRDRAEMFYEPVCHAIDKFELRAIPAFLATIAIESNRLQAVEESLYYNDPARIARIYLRLFDVNKDRRITPEEIEAAKPYVRNHAKMSELLYHGYHGRGLIQLTWLKNYQEASDALGYDYVGHPDWVKAPDHAALTAGWFWSAKGCDDVGYDIREATRIVNPALMHLAERTEQYERNVEIFA